MPMPQLNVDNISILDRFDFDSIKLKRSSWNGYFDPIEIFAERLLGIILSKFPVSPPPVIWLKAFKWILSLRNKISFT